MTKKRSRHPPNKREKIDTIKKTKERASNFQTEEEIEKLLKQNIDELTRGMPFSEKDLAIEKRKTRIIPREHEIPIKKTIHITAIIIVMLVVIYLILRYM